MKFLIDNQLPSALARWLTEKGHDAVHVLDIEQAQTDDRELWAKALSEGRIMISKDEDFFILATRPGDTGRPLWLRLGNGRKQALLSRLDHLWPQIEAAFESRQTLVEVKSPPLMERGHSCPQQPRCPRTQSYQNLLP